MYDSGIHVLTGNKYIQLNGAFIGDRCSGNKSRERSMYHSTKVSRLKRERRKGSVEDSGAVTYSCLLLVSVKIVEYQVYMSITWTFPLSARLPF
jgi:hypothetical protein